MIAKQLVFSNHVSRFSGFTFFSKKGKGVYPNQQTQKYDKASSESLLYVIVIARQTVDSVNCIIQQGAWFRKPSEFS
jgi:hypothetical protein